MQIRNGRNRNITKKPSLLFYVALYDIIIDLNSVANISCA